MTLPNKIKYALIDLGSRLIREQGTLRAILDEAGIDYSDIELEGSMKAVWNNLVSALSFDQVESLLFVLTERYPGNTDISAFVENLDRGNIVNLMAHLVDIIKAKECVLFLGPWFLTCLEEQMQYPFYKYFSGKLADKLTQNHIYYDHAQRRNLSYIIDRYETKERFATVDTQNEALTAYREGRPSDIFYRQVFSLKFPLIINTNPDMILPDLFGNNCHFDYYDITNNPDERNIQSQMLSSSEDNKTIVYNIYGSFKNQRSVLLTEKDAVNFTKKIYSSQEGIPDALKSIIRERYGIFLGFDFREWHFKILFDVLDLKNKPGNYCFVETYMNVMEHDQEYYERYYHMTFIKNDILKMFDQLKQKAYGNS